MSEFTQRATELADLMREFNMNEAELKGDGWKVAFRRRTSASDSSETLSHEGPTGGFALVEPASAAAGPTGAPITSPMTGIYYSAPSPNSPPFVKEGDRVEAGQVVALIEAMKVFNEITAPMSGTVHSVVFENGSLVNHGDHLIYVG